MTETGYDLAVLSRPTGEARFANVRKMARLAAEFETREGRDLRGFLDFLAARAEGEAEAQAATAAEGHDGVRILTVHNAKGLEFEVVAVPDLARSLLAGGRAPLLVVGREEEPRVGLQLRRLGTAAINLFDYGSLCEEARERDAEEGLRLFHVAATRAKQRLILSGVVKPEPGKETKASTPVVERLVDALGIPRDADATVPVAPPEPRPGLEAAFEPSEIAVRANLPSPERTAELRTLRRREATERELGKGPPPLVERDPPVVPSRPLSYTAISAYKECPYRFYLERVLGLARSEQDTGVEGEPSAREERTARGAAVHALLEWSQANGWAEPSEDLALLHAVAAGVGSGSPPQTHLANGSMLSVWGRTPRPHGSPMSCSIPSGGGSGRRCGSRSRAKRSGRGRRSHFCSESETPFFGDRSIYWRSVRASPRWLLITRPISLAMPIPLSGPPATRCSVRSMRWRLPRRWAWRRSRWRTSFSSGPMCRSLRRLGRRRWWPRGTVWRWRSVRSAAVSSQWHRQSGATGRFAGAVRRFAACARVLSQPTSEAVSSFAARSSR